MGVSTDGILFFGALIDEEAAGEFEDEDNSGWSHLGWEDKYAELHGIVDESNLFNEEGEYAVLEGSVAYHARKQIYDEYYDKRRELAEACPVDIGMHCAGEYPMYYIAVKTSVVTASRGYPEKLDIGNLLQSIGKLKCTGSDIDILKDFCDKLGLPYEEPSWYLTSLWS